MEWMLCEIEQKKLRKKWIRGGGNFSTIDKIQSARKYGGEKSI